MADAITLLRQDHRDVKRMFREWMKLGPRANTQKRRLADRILVELARHSQAEELLVYPRLRNEIPGLDDDVLESLEEHHIVKTVCSELETLPVQDERFKAKMTVLMENVVHHADEEEETLFPRMRRHFSRSELRDLGEAIAAVKPLAPTRAHPHAPDEPPGNVIAGAAAAPLDVAVTGVRHALHGVRRR